MKAGVRAVIIMVATALAPGRAGAGSGASPGGLRLAADAGFGATGGVATSNLSASVDLREGALAVSLAARFRLALRSGDGPVLRSRDWDEPSDFLHILRRFAYARRVGSVALAATAGELGGLTLGHGSILRDYSSAADPDHPATGLVLEAGHARGKLVAFVNDLASPRLAGGRLALRPIPAARAFVVGLTGVVDARAPVAILRDPDGRPLVTAGQRLAAREEPLGLLGVDLGWELGGPRGWKLTPYVDLNTSLRGVGLHAGASGRWPLAGGWLAAQAEYRVTSGGYAPAHAGTFYDVERYQVSLGGARGGDPAGAAAAPKLAALEAGLFGGHGFLAEAAVGLPAAANLVLRLGGSLQGGPDPGALWLRATARPGGRVDLGLLVALRGFGRGSRGDLRLGAAVMAEARVRITPYLYALGQLARRWALDLGAGGFRPFTAFNLALGATWSG